MADLSQLEDLLDQGREPTFVTPTSELPGWSPSRGPSASPPLDSDELNLGDPVQPPAPPTARGIALRGGGGSEAASGGAAGAGGADAGGADSAAGAFGRDRSGSRATAPGSPDRAGSAGPSASGGAATSVGAASPKASPPRRRKTSADLAGDGAPDGAGGGQKPRGKPPAGIKPKPKMSKAERRALQEKQRAEKEARKAAGLPAKKGRGGDASSKSPALRGASGGGSSGGGGGASASAGGGTSGGGKSKRAKENVSRTLVPRDKQVPLFSHLVQYERESSLSQNVGFASNEPVHPAILRVGLKYGEGSIVGGNARCVAMLTAFKQFIGDYVSPPSKPIAWDLDKRLRSQIEFLTKCRPHSHSMGNAIRYVRSVITHIPPDMSDNMAIEELHYRIDRFIEERIRVADEAIVNQMVGDDAPRKIVDGDVILTYGRSHVVEMVLKAAHQRGIDFRVIVADGRPRMEGKELLRRLERTGVKCTYVLMNAVSYVMKEVTKFVTGAAAMMSNGALLSRVGTAVVAMVANAYNKPVLVCCETYKFCNKVQIDSITSNELGDPDDLVSQELATGRRSFARDLGVAGGSSAGAGAGAAGGAARSGAAAAAGGGDGAIRGDEQSNPLSDYRDIAELRLLNLVYDLTPIEHVTAVVTEFGVIPPTSVPVINRERKDDPESFAPVEDLM